MRETRFIDIHRSTWKTYEKQLDQGKKNPDKITELYVEITDDLSYANTFYKHRSIRVYLNSLAQLLFLGVYKNQKTDNTRLWTFWTEELPAIFWHSRKEFISAFVLFAVAVAIGVFSTHYNPEFARQILGDGYINQTLRNIESGDPMAVYKNYGQTEMFVSITINNISVALYTFAFGFLYGIGSIFALLRNGVMLGTFQYFFFQQGIYKESLLTIWQHGTIEISAIIIAGAAGLIVGKGLIFPGTFSRSLALKNSAKKGFKVFISTVPLFIMAGFIEGFITRQTDLPDMVRIMVIVGSLLLILSYYVLYPLLLPKKVKDEYAFEGQNEEPSDYRFQNQEIKSIGEVFTDTMRIATKLGSKVLPTALIAAFLYGMLAQMAIYFEWGVSSLDSFDLFDVTDYFNFTDSPLLFVVNSLFFGTFLYQTFKQFHLYVNKNYTSKLKQEISIYGHTVLLAAGIQLLFFIENGWAMTLFLLNVPVWLTAMYLVRTNKINAFSAIGKALGVMNAQFGNMLVSYLTFLFIGFLFFIIIFSPFIYMYFEVVSWNLPFSPELSTAIMSGIFSTIILIFIAMSIGLIAIGFGVYSYSAKEVMTAEGLMAKIKAIGQQKTIYGMERESKITSR